MVLGYPSRLKIFLTADCNLKCKYCFINKTSSRQNKDTPLIHVKNAIDNFLYLPGGKKTILFTGGEPFLKLERLKSLYLYAKRSKNKEKPDFVVTTNGTLLDSRSFKFIKDSGIHLDISIDGRKEITDHNRIFRTKKYSVFNKVTSNIRLLLSDKGIARRTSAILVFTPATVNSLSDNVIFLHNLGFRYVNFYPELYSIWPDNVLMILRKQLAILGKFYINLHTGAQNKGFFLQNSFLERVMHNGRKECFDCCDTVHLGVDGNFYFCDKIFSLPFEEWGKFKIGEAKEGIDNHLRIKWLNKYKKIFLKQSQCNSCDYSKYCFCLLGHALYFSAQGMEFKRYLKGFCMIFKAYIEYSLRIKEFIHSNVSLRQ